MLSIKLAEQIVLQTKERLHHNINVISTDGVILASKDIERIDSIHEGALQVVKTGTPIYIHEEHAKNLHNSKPGVNLPIHFHDRIIGVIGITGEPEELKEIASLVQLTTEMIVHQVLTESKQEWQRKNGDFIFKSLIGNAGIDEEVQERIQKLPFSISGPYQIILIEQTSQTAFTTLELQLENILYRHSALFGQTELNEYYLFICGETSNNRNSIIQQLQKLQHKFQIKIGVGPVVENLEELPFVYKSAKTALSFSEVQHITYFHDIEIYTLFKNKTSYEIDKFTEKIASLTEKMHLTLNAFFECSLQLNLCAEMLDIHRHTLKYRLNKIHELTGYDPHNFEDAFVLKLALTLNKQKV